MLENDATYYRRRAEAELDQAQKSTHPQVVRAHYELAEAYLERTATSKPPGRTAND